MPFKKHSYVIGVDGGGTKTIAALSDLNGKILKMAKVGSSNPRNVGIKKAIENIIKAINNILPKSRKIKITSIFIGLPAVEEEFGLKTKKIRKEILKQRKISQSLKGKMIIGSDQLLAFRAGTDKRDGVVLIAGTGCVSHGWKEKKEYKTSGWGWLADEGAAFWIGQKVFQSLLKDLDGRGPKTLLTDFIFRKFGIKKRDPNLLNQKIYSQNFNPLKDEVFLPGFIKKISLLSCICNEAAKKGDKTAKNILTEAGKELTVCIEIVIKKLNFSKEKFPLVLVGGTLKSKIVLDTIKIKIKKIAPNAEFIIPKKEAVTGAVKLAIEELNMQKF